MRISEMIKELENFKLELGDVEVVVTINGFGGHATHCTTNVYKSSLDAFSAEESDIDETEFREIFPDTDEEGEVVVVEIGTGNVIKYI